MPVKSCGFPPLSCDFFVFRLLPPKRDTARCFSGFTAACVAASACGSAFKHTKGQLESVLFAAETMCSQHLCGPIVVFQKIPPLPQRNREGAYTIRRGLCPVVSGMRACGHLHPNGRAVKEKKMFLSKYQVHVQRDTYCKRVHSIKTQKKTARRQL